MAMRVIKAKHLIEWLKNQPEDALIVVPAFDHAYRTPQPEEGEAVIYKGGGIIEEYHGDKLMQEGGEKIPVIVFR